MFSKLTNIKITHSVIWVFFNFVIFYMLYAAIENKLDWKLWAGYGLILLEGIVLLIFNKMCPLTIMARKYSQSPKYNFDIYLPEWLARYNKQVYTIIVIIIMLLTVYQLSKR